MDIEYEHEECELSIEIPEGLVVVQANFISTQTWELQDDSSYCECIGRCHHMSSKAELLESTVDEVTLTEAHLFPRMPDGTVSDQSVTVPLTACDRLLGALLQAAVEYAEDYSYRVPTERDFEEAAFDPPY